MNDSWFLDNIKIGRAGFNIEKSDKTIIIKCITVATTNSNNDSIDWAFIKRGCDAYRAQYVSIKPDYVMQLCELCDAIYAVKTRASHNPNWLRVICIDLYPVAMRNLTLFVQGYLHRDPIIELAICKLCLGRLSGIPLQAWEMRSYKIEKYYKKYK